MKQRFPRKLKKKLKTKQKLDDFLIEYIGEKGIGFFELFGIKHSKNETK